MYRARLLRPDPAMIPKVRLMMASQELVAVLALILVLVVALALGNRIGGGLAGGLLQTICVGVQDRLLGRRVLRLRAVTNCGGKSTTGRGQ